MNLAQVLEPLGRKVYRYKPSDSFSFLKPVYRPTGPVLRHENNQAEIIRRINLESSKNGGRKTAKRPAYHKYTYGKFERSEQKAWD